MKNPWLWLTTILAWTNPFVMLAFALIWSFLRLEDLTGIEAFISMGSNTDRINLFLFLPIGSLLYFAWLRAQVALVAKLRPRLARDRFLWSKLLGNLPACAVGSLNLLAFSFGMEGNVFGFMFALPLAAAGLTSIVIWIVQTVRVFRGRFDAPAPHLAVDSQASQAQATA